MESGDKHSDIFRYYVTITDNMRQIKYDTLIIGGGTKKQFKKLN